MSWQQLLARGEIKAHQTSKQELDNIRALIARDLADAGLAGLSADRRFATAYNAALQAGKIAIGACRTLRSSSSRPKRAPSRGAQFRKHRLLRQRPPAMHECDNPTRILAIGGDVQHPESNQSGPARHQYRRHRLLPHEHLDHRRRKWRARHRLGRTLQHAARPEDSFLGKLQKPRGPLLSCNSLTCTQNLSSLN